MMAVLVVEVERLCINSGFGFLNLINVFLTKFDVFHFERNKLMNSVDGKFSLRKPSHSKFEHFHAS